MNKGGIVWVGTVLLVIGLAHPANAAQYRVNSTADTDDGRCDNPKTSTDNCTLREAINASNDTENILDSIDFDLARPAANAIITIELLTPLPKITDAVQIDGSVAEDRTGLPGDVVIDPAKVGFDLAGNSPTRRPGVVLDGINAYANDALADGFYLPPGWAAAPCAALPTPGVRCYASDATEIFVYNDNTSTADADKVDVARVHALWLASHQGSEIRGLVIQRFSGAGIFLDHGGSHRIMGNYFGTDVTGTLGGASTPDYLVLDPDTGWLERDDTVDATIPYGNGFPAAFGNAVPNLAGPFEWPPFFANIYGSSTSYNLIGDLEANNRNVMAGGFYTILMNATDGGFVEEPYLNADGNEVKGNFVGVGAFGDELLGNAASGVRFQNLDFVDSASAQELRDTVVMGNVISNTASAIGFGHGAHGVGLGGSFNGLVSHNHIGADVTGLLAMATGDGSRGILVFDSDQQTAENNLLATHFAGVEYRSLRDSTIRGNIMGVDRDKGLNDITFNISYGIISFSQGVGPNDSVQILDNFIANSSNGGVLLSSEHNLLFQGNTVIRSGDSASGPYPTTGPHHAIFLTNESQDVRILDNYIGVDPDNPLDTTNGNAEGIGVGSYTMVELGGVPTVFVPAHWFVPQFFGLMIGPQRVLIEGNTIAYNAEGGIDVLGEHDNEITDHCSVNFCLDARTLAPMVLPYDDGLNGDALGVTILGNSIFANGSGLGIDLSVATETANLSYAPLIAIGTPDGVTANDAADADTGPNDLQNFPVLSEESVWNPSQVVAKGTLHSAPMREYRIEFFANSSVDSSGHGEGEQFIGSTVVTTDATGFAEFTQPTGVTDLVGDGRTSFLTSTATGPSGTSEFSPALELRRRGQ